MNTNPQRGYYQLELGGKTRTLHFSMNFWAAFEQATGYSISQLGEVFSNGISLMTIRGIIYAGLLANDQEEGNKIDYTIYSVGNWMEEVTPEMIDEISQAMMSSKILGMDLNAGVRRNVTKSTKNPKQKTQ
jgi:hypothetical protein